MKILLLLTFALLVVRFSRADDEGDDVRVKDTFLKEEVLRKFTEMHMYSDPEMTQTYLKELKEIMENELPDDPEIRKDILNSIYENLGEGQGQKNNLGQAGHRGGPDPVEPFQEDPLPK